MIVVQTPLRVSFLGGGTDFENFYATNGGAVLSTAIDKCTFVVIKERYDKAIYINYSKKEIVNKVDELEHGLVREAMRLTGVKNGVEITTLADVPSGGTGLGSSSSITVGLLQALYTYQGKLVSAEDLAKEACQIEIDILGRPIGKQDQYICAYGNMCFITFRNDGVTVEKIELPGKGKRKLNENLMLFHTGISRQASEILAEQKANNKAQAPLLQEMVNLVFEAKQALVSEAFDEFGVLLHRGWELKKQFSSKVTNTQIDEIYNAARQAGALGGKIVGAGSGGFMLLYCPAERRDNVRSNLRGLRELPFRFEGDGSKVIFNYRR